MDFVAFLLKLTVMMHLAENRQIIPSYIDIINCLGKNFLVKFSTFYSPRHCVSVVHSVIHISDTIYDFGPLHTFTTFNFENELGKISFKKIYLFLLLVFLNDLLTHVSITAPEDMLKK